MSRGLPFGVCCIELRGAAPEAGLNALAKGEVRFWNIVREDPLRYRICIAPGDRHRAQMLALEAYCETELLYEHSIREKGKELLRRPVLVFGLLSVLFMSFFLQSFVWVIEVRGTESLHPKQILRALEEQGIRFGTRAAPIDSQETKLQMLSALPRIEWLAVNRRGGKLTVTVLEREEIPAEKDGRPGNIVAVRDGIIEDFSISEGMRLVQRGEAVEQGQLLVSGLEDYGLYLRGVQAKGEIYGRTWHTSTVVIPKETYEKVYEEASWKGISLVLGRKRINLCGSSGILPTSCDKMVSTKTLTILGYTFPLRLELETYRKYSIRAGQRSAEESEDLLQAAWERNVQSSMIAGSIREQKSEFLETESLYVLHGRGVCRELIGRFQALEEIYKGEAHE